MYGGIYLAYRIWYEDTGSMGKRPDGIGRGQLLCSLILFGLIVLGSLYSVPVKEEISAVFLPGRIEKIALEYASGNSARKVLIDQCRQVLADNE